MCVMARLTGDLQRLGRYVSDRVAELGLTQEQVQELGGPSPATLRLIMSGGRKSLQPASVGGLERVLQWGSGSVRAILANGEPTSRTDADMTTAEMLAEANADMDAIEAELDRRIRRMWQINDREQLAELLRTLRALQDK